MKTPLPLEGIYPLKGYIDQSTNFSREVGKAIFVIPFFQTVVTNF